MRIHISETGKPVSTLLEEQGTPLDTRCGGNGTCGRCRITLLSGRWNVNGSVVDVTDAPVSATGCNTRLLSATGMIDVPDASRAPHNGKISSDWIARPLPASPDTVVAVDIGTTTLAAVKIRDGHVIAKASCFNSQSKYGDNVISRINCASQSKAYLDDLQTEVVSCINRLIDELDAHDAARVAVAGNTVMTCLLHGVDPKSIGMMPFTPPLRIFPVCDCASLGINASSPLHTLPCISGYIGGDITAGIAETQLGPGEMLVDVGTNCEIVFNTGTATVCAAAAAGPAFEGAGILAGCRAVDGAIDHYFGGDVFSVIGNTRAKGLCGSAMVDFLAVERQAGHLSEFGRLEPKAALFQITDDIAISERDVEQLLKAKSAVWSGITTLENHCGRQATRIFLAGGFAKYMNVPNAVAIAMLPDREYLIVGNTSLAGAARVACLPELMACLVSLIDIPVELPLNTLPGFEDNFIDGLMLP